MKHTPGPWKIERIDDDEQPFYKVVVAPMREISVIEGRSYDEASANARLIAAAPELLNALKELVLEICQSGCDDYMNEASAFANTFNKRLAAAEDAIAKAEGREPNDEILNEVMTDEIKWGVD